MIDLEALKTLFPLSIEDEKIIPHLNRAIWDYKDKEFEDDIQELEVVGSKTLYYLAPLLWVDMQTRADEYDESINTFKDVESFKQNWLDRANSALSKDDESVTDSEVFYACI
jgi:hypothetical protein